MYMHLTTVPELRPSHLNKCIPLESSPAKRLSLDSINGLGMKRIFLAYINPNPFRTSYGTLTHRRDHK